MYSLAVPATPAALQAVAVQCIEDVISADSAACPDSCVDMFVSPCHLAWTRRPLAALVGLLRCTCLSEWQRDLVPEGRLRPGVCPNPGPRTTNLIGPPNPPTLPSHRAPRWSASLPSPT